MPTGLGSDFPSTIIPEPSTFWYLSTWGNTKYPGDPDAQTLNGDQAITVEQAVTAYTLGSAQAMGYDWPDKVGSIESGKFADFVVLDRDIFDIPTDTIHETTVEMTVFGGEVVYETD